MFSVSSDIPFGVLMTKHSNEKISNEKYNASSVSIELMVCTLESLGGMFSSFA